jgi:hypothetical protein
VKSAWITYKKSLAISTRNGYRTAWKDFLIWARAFSEPNNPIDPINPTEISLMLWLEYLSQFIQPDSAVKYLYGVRDSLIDLTGKDVLKRKPRLKKMRRALKKAGGARKPRWRGITVAVLAKVRPFVDFSDHDHRCAWAMATTGTYSLQRIGEFAPVASARASYPLGGHTRLFEDHGKTFLPRSKTDVFNQGVQLVWPKTGTMTCPWTAVAQYRTESTVRLTCDSPAWQKSDGSPADRAWLIALFRSWAKEAGLPWWEYSGISFRRGGAQTLAFLGVSDRLIQALGRWKSACFKRYVGMMSQEVLQAGRTMSGGESVEVEKFEEISFDVRAWSSE